MKYGPPISLDAAKRIVAAAETEAVRNGWPMVIAIVDSGGHLVLFHRLDNAQLGSVVVAQRKAETALLFKRPTKAFDEAVTAGGAGLRFLSVEDACAPEGGFPIVQGETIIGAIGVSGMKSDQDAQVAIPGLQAITSCARRGCSRALA